MEFEVFEKLLKEIDAAESQLSQLRSSQSSRPSVHIEAKTLAEEVQLLKNAGVEGLVEDDQSQYFIAVGQLEQQVQHLRVSRESNARTMEFNKADLRSLKYEIEKQKQLLEKFETELSKPSVVEEINDKKKKEFIISERHNKLNLKHLKKELKDFIEDTEKLKSNYDEGRGSKYGYLLQALWTSFINHGAQDYLSIEELEFDVEEEVLQKLLQAGVIVYHKDDKDLIRLVDFTMTN